MRRKETSPEKTAWMQLGWMLAWILEPGEDYPDRDFEGLSDNMKETALLKTLLQQQGGSSTANLHEPHHHRAQGV